VNTVRGVNILSQQNGILVHCANAQGVMGAGIALQIKQLYPQVYYDYKEHLKCMKSDEVMGSICITQILEKFYIVTGIGQLYYGRNNVYIHNRGTNSAYVDYNSIDNIFSKVKELAMDTKLRVIFPKIGAGLAGGDWVKINDIIEKIMYPEVSCTLYLL